MELKELLKKLIQNQNPPSVPMDEVPQGATTLKAGDGVPQFDLSRLRGAGSGLSNAEDNIEAAKMPPILPARTLAPTDQISGDTSNIRFAVGNRPTNAYDANGTDIYNLTPMQKLEQQINTPRDYKGFSLDHPYIGKDRETKKRGIVDFLKAAGIGALQGIGSGNGIGGAIGGAVAGTVGEAVDKNFNKKWMDSLKDAQALKQYGTLSQIEDDKLAKRAKTAQIDNIYADNETAKQRNADLAEYRNQTIAQKNQTAADKARNAALTKIYSGQFFDPANPAHRQMAITAGLNPDELPKVDLRRPDIKTIGDTTYIYNRETGKLEDSGIPKQGNKSLVDYTVVDPNTGIEATYTTTSEKAAGLKQSFANAGMQIKAANERQDKQIAATATENDKKRDFELKKQQIGEQLRREFADYQDKLKQANAERDFERRKQLMQEAEESRRRAEATRQQYRIEIEEQKGNIVNK